METAIYIVTQGETIPETKTIYHLPIDGLNYDEIMRMAKSDIAIFQAYGLSDSTANELIDAIQALVTTL